MIGENKKIAKAIRLLEHGQWRERKEYLHQMREKGSCSIDGFEFREEVYCWVIWKPTDSEKEPQWKGESLFKVVPSTDLTEKQIINILGNQSWIYP